jgi:elongator complex protein 3
MTRLDWYASLAYTPEMLATARSVLEDVRGGMSASQAVRRHPLPGGGYLAKHVLVAAYRQLVESGAWQPDPVVLERIRMKPVRTLSGVTTVTVLTGACACPGECIFCPSEAHMPKSYLHDEPGAARAFQNNFDPYLQVQSRLDAYAAVGHPTDKIELLILGGTWSVYPADYQEQFIRRCYDSLNGIMSENLEQAQVRNETAAHRNVGLVIETRPDWVTPAELLSLRRLGVTKVQLGAQSLDDHILELNRRGHSAAETLQACALLRAAGFKIVLHWMPNLLGATLDSDRQDFARLWQGCCPDEIKIYPTQLLKSAELYNHWQRGEYQPYTQEELVGLIADLKPSIPPYCRVNRVIRDIGAQHVVAGNKRTSLRQDILAEVERRGQHCNCIRCREVRGEAVEASALCLEDTIYHPAYAEEHFLTYVTPQGRIAGYLRLSLPTPEAPRLDMPDLAGAAIVREVHIFGQALGVGQVAQGATQHSGLGRRLLERAEEIARAAGLPRLAVISATGTRRYYTARGFRMGELYMVKPV